MDKLIFTITDAGRQAIINASNTGTEKVEIKSVGIGSSYYITSPEQTDIHDEIKRITSIGGAVISPDTIHVSAKDDSPDEYVVHTVGLYTDKNILFAVYSRRMPIINKSSATVMLISSDITFKSLDTANITFGDVVFINPPASESVVGVSRFATAEEVEEGLDPAIAVSAKRLKGELDKKANLDSPNLTGTPTAPTTAESDNSQKIATTAFIKQVLLAYAKLASPNFTGKPTAPTADQSSNDTQLATTAFVRSAIAALVDSSPGALDTLNELAAALGDDPNFATTMTNALAGKQPLDGTLTNLSGKDVPALLQYLGLGETINLAAGALQKDQNGADIPDKKQFARTIGAVTSNTITLGESGWFKIATVVMPQATSTAVIKLYGGAGFNAGSSEQGAISELVLRAGNGSPAGITATLWRRSPAAANEVAWVNTSGDTYDIYINIGQYAYWLIAQYDYTGNANVTLHSTPEYSSVQPGNSTSGQTYTIYSSLMKPTSEDVGALSVNGGQLNGPLSIGTDNALGGNSIVLGDNDTGFKQNGDGILDTYANSQHTVRVAPGEMMVLGAIRAGKEKKLSLTSNNNSTMTATFNLWGDANRPTVIELDDDQGWQLYSQRNPDGSVLFTVNGDITANVLRAGEAIYQNNGDIFGSLWGNGWLSTWINNNLVLDVQLGAGTSVTTWNNAGSWPNTPGYVVTSVWKDYQGENIDGINYAPLQKRVGNQWYTVQGGTV
ncbi:tail protein [Salmonella enterica subsp. enterica serovar Bovismorbificans]|uniref:Tail protein n=3 Tax=Enterobacteriaceae TaxID=543 RepID=A0A655BVS5_SALET|nr:tail protein [Salmonella enterica subsp. enterica serovar Bovismorbificans str. 3114]CNT82062.1 tail protein [Salmonella enterica subsp. enterica serovar Bovismorbificans]CNU28363.1 tail protein [Salmonella enterica subsp. enterica serovar Bovismorbificans]CNU43930.1 tail protein [Salmonella enterica subsp. enterica serovar Bovismorbificans]CNU57817.1 tail protein [Salmonella enterica subsp. enterica serovar Bovismorbificans]